MPLDIQMPEVADRLRRFFQTRGRMPTRLDEAIVPVAIVQDLNQSPWRVNTHDGIVGASAAAVVGELSFVTLQHPASQPGRTVIDQLFFPNNTSAARNYSVRIRGIGSPAPALALTSSDEADNVEDLTRSLDGGTPGETGLIIATGDLAAATGTELFTVVARGDDTLVLPVRITLAPAWQLVIWNAAANVVTAAGFRFTYHPNA